MKAHVQPKQSNMTIGNLYDLNKQAMNMENPLSKNDICDKIFEMIDFYNQFNYQYYMLLCREEYNFTLFNAKNHSLDTPTSFFKDMFECLLNRGEVISIEPDGGNAFEIWIRHDNENVCYYFFPYDEGVIEVQGG